MIFKSTLGSDVEFNPLSRKHGVISLETDAVSSLVRADQ
jgi:hypothetical protein